MASQQAQEDEHNEQATADKISSDDNQNASNNTNTNITTDNGDQQPSFQQALLASRMNLAQTYTRTIQELNTDIVAIVRANNTTIREIIQHNNETLQQAMQRIDDTFSRMARDVDANDEALIRNAGGRLASPPVDRPLPHDRPHNPNHKIGPQAATLDERGTLPSRSPFQSSPPFLDPPRETFPQHRVERRELSFNTHRLERIYVLEVIRSLRTRTGGRWVYDSTGDGSSEDFAHVQLANQPPFENNPRPSARDVHLRRQTLIELGRGYGTTTGIDIHWVDNTDPDDWFERGEPDPTATQQAESSGIDFRPGGSVSGEGDTAQQTQINAATHESTSADNNTRASISIGEAAETHPDTEHVANIQKRRPYWFAEDPAKNIKTLHADKKPEDNPEAIIAKRTRSGKTPAPALPQSTGEDNSRQASATNNVATTATARSKSGKKRARKEEHDVPPAKAGGLNNLKNPVAGQSQSPSKRRKQYTKNDNDIPAAAAQGLPDTAGKEIKVEATEASKDSRSSQPPSERGASPDTFNRRMANVPDEPSWDTVKQALRGPPRISHSECAHRSSTQRGNLLHRSLQAPQRLRQDRQREARGQLATDRSSRDDTNGPRGHSDEENTHGEESDDEE